MGAVKRIASCLIAALSLARGLGAATAPDAPELTRLLKEFLAGASRNDAAIHDRFWAPDLIYTGSAGRRIGKADIMKDVRTPAPPPVAPAPPEPATIYTAEDVRIQQYGNTAIVAFRLVGTTDGGGRHDVSRYLNSGTFLKRAGRWQVVNWQATRMPRPADEAKAEVATARLALQHALQRADVKALEALLDDGFAWTSGAAPPLSRKALLERLASGPLEDPKWAAEEGTVALFGDAAVVRGASSTLLLVYDGSGWKAVSLLTSLAP